VKIVIFTEGGRKTGFGHVNRCMALCQAFEEQGYKPAFIINGDRTAGDLLKRKKHEIFDWARDRVRLSAILRCTDIAIVDSYLAKPGVYKSIAERARLAVYIDDLNRTSYAKGIVLNCAIWARRLKYPDRPHLRYLLGSKYALLRKEFWEVSRKPATSRMADNILVTFGGADPLNMTPRVLDHLVKEHPSMKKQVVVGKGFKNIRQILKSKDANTKVHYYPDARGMKSAMLKADLAISSGGQTLFELARLGVPTIGICLAHNQSLNLSGFAKRGFVRSAGWFNEDTLFRRIDACIRRLNFKNRLKMSRTGMKLIDGMGPRRAVRRILARAAVNKDARADRAGTDLMEKAVSSKNLVNRSGGNQRYGTGDFNSWSNELIGRIKFSSVLDVCCGTGNQLVLYADRADVRKIIGVDLSPEALDIAEKRLQKTGSKARIILKKTGMEAMFSDPAIRSGRFDLISCFYGLYYSRDPGNTISQMIDHLRPDGAILIVGPYGANNGSLFGLLERHFKLPELVKRSSSTFMEKEVLPLLKQRLDTRTEYFLNRVCYPDSESLLGYWRASTFYSARHEPAISRDIKIHFDRNSTFTVEKHIMACIARKRA
jgi:UDP-2,4-diacetamido-2,4,6-trideoxy-beta-L-altropyranose hydrolase